MAMDIASDPSATQASEKALWNPNAAANWSLLFTAAFGAYLHMLNWRALGEPAREEASRRWFLAGLGLLGLNLWVAVFPGNEVIDVVSRLALGILLLSWYFVSAKPQARYVKDRYQDGYPHKPWGKVLLVAMGAVLAYYALAAVVGLVGRYTLGS